MNTIKKTAGLLWILLAPLAIFFLVRTAAHEISAKPGLDTKIQWLVFIIIFIPIAIGLAIFGYYAWKGEYNNVTDQTDGV